MEEKEHLYRNLIQNESNVQELGQSVGLICFTDKLYLLVCSFCKSVKEFNEVLSFVSHIKRFHSSIVNSNISKKSVKQEVFDKETKSTGIKHDDSSVETNTNLKDNGQKTTTKLSDQLFQFDKNIDESFNAVDIHSEQFYCTNCKSNFKLENELLKHICTYIATRFKSRANKQHKSNRQLNSSENLKELLTTNDEQIVHQINSKKTYKTDSNEFHCNKYNIDFQSEDEVLKYTSLRLNDFKSTSCERFFTYKGIKIHMRVENGKKLYKCEYENCNRAYTQTSALLYHIRCHTGEKPYKCELCSLTFRSKANLTKHMPKHTEDRFKCDYENCDRVFSTNYTLLAHKRFHTGEKHFTCEVCQLAFPRKDKLTVHMIKHTNKRFKCEFEECYQAYDTIASLQKHQAICHVKPKIIQCPQCDEKFRLSRDLNYHLASKHGCPLCLKAYGPLSNLEKHLLTCIEKKS